MFKFVPKNKNNYNDCKKEMRSHGDSTESNSNFYEIIGHDQ